MKIGIVGLGLIGGSVGRDVAAKPQWTERMGFDLSKANEKQALDLDLIDSVLPLDSLCKKADLIVLAVPVDAIVSLLPQVLDLIDDDGVVTDMGSTKASICKSVADHPHRSRFVASHPMAGTENSGPLAAQRYLFANKTAVLCETDRSDDDALNAVKGLYQDLLMHLIYMNAEEHDRHTALVSHLSHITSFILAETVLNEEENDQTIFDLASGGFESTVRLGKSSPEMWASIFEHNREYVTTALKSYLNQLQSFHDFLSSGNRQEMVRVMSHANNIRRVLSRMTDQKLHLQLPTKGGTEFKSELKALRKEIDDLDQRLLETLNLRLRIVRRIGALKKENGASFVQEDRKKQVINQFLSVGQALGLRPDFARTLFEIIHDESITQQEEES